MTISKMHVDARNHTICFLDRKSARDFFSTCREYRKLTRDESVQKILLTVHFPYYKSVSNIPYARQYRQLSAAHSMNPGVRSYELEKRKEDLLALELTSDEKRIVAKYEDAIVVYNLETRSMSKPIFSPRSENNDILRLTPDGKYAITQSADCNINIHDLASGEVRTIVAGREMSKQDLQITPDSQNLILLDLVKSRKIIKVIDIPTLETYEIDLDTTLFQISADGKYLYTAYHKEELFKDNELPDIALEDWELYILDRWDFKTKKSEKNIQLHFNPRRYAVRAISPNGEQVIFRERELGGSFIILDLGKDWCNCDKKSQHNHVHHGGNYFNGLDLTDYINRDGTIAVSHSRTGLKTFDLKTYSCTIRIYRGGDINSIHITPDTKTAVLGTQDGTMLVNLETERRQMFGMQDIDAVQINAAGTQAFAVSNSSNKIVCSDFTPLPEERLAELNNEEDINPLPWFAIHRINEIHQTHSLEDSIIIYQAEVNLPDIVYSLRESKPPMTEDELNIRMMSLPVAIKHVINENFHRILAQNGIKLSPNFKKFGQVAKNPTLLPHAIQALSATLEHFKAQ